MVGKPSIARKLRRIPCNFIFFAIFGGKRRPTSVQLAYVCMLNIMQHVCVRGVSVQQGAYMFQKMFFKKKPQQYFEKLCKWKGQCLVCTCKAFLDNNRCRLMCEVRREIDGQNTLQYLY
jgi:hypothetical protein